MGVCKNYTALIDDVVTTVKKLELPLETDDGNDRQAGDGLGVADVAVVVIEDGVAAVERVDDLEVRRKVEIEAADAAAERALQLRVDADVGLLRFAGHRAAFGVTRGAAIEHAEAERLRFRLRDRRVRQSRAVADPDVEVAGAQNRSGSARAHEVATTERLCAARLLFLDGPDPGEGITEPPRVSAGAAANPEVDAGGFRFLGAREVQPVELLEVAVEPEANPAAQVLGEPEHEVRRFRDAQRQAAAAVGHDVAEEDERALRRPHVLPVLTTAQCERDAIREQHGRGQPRREPHLWVAGEY